MAVNCVTIEKTVNGYIFQVNAPQNHNQPLGKSAKVYPNAGECKNAMKSFIAMVRTHTLQTEDGRFVKIENKGDNYYFRYYDENEQCIFERTIGYPSKANCEAGIKAVFNVVNHT